jgi:nucleotide-binding universal stress UspA family protein
MKRFRNILVHADGRDGGRAALKRGIDLAVKNDARLTIAEVVPELPPNIRKLQELKPVAELEQMAIDDAATRLNDLISECDVRGQKIEPAVLVGTPFVELIRRVLINQHDLLIKTAAQPHGLSERIFGTTGLHLLRKCPCPVWIVKPESQGGFRNILVAMDVFSEDDADSRLNFDLLQLATSLATQESAKLHAVTAWALWMEGYLRTARKGADRVDAARKELEYSAKQKLDELLSQFASASIAAHVENGEPDEVIPRVTRDTETDLLIMGTVGRSGLSGMFMGNTADRILDQVKCSVLALKPGDFETPISLPPGATG